MSREIPPLEPVARFARYAPTDIDAPWGQSARVKLFAITFAVVCIVGVIITALQPSIFQASATVLMTAPVAIDEREQTANVQDVAIQRRILLGSQVTQQLAELLQAQGRDDISAAYLRHVLHVDPLTDTNLVEMSARGSDGDILPRLVNSWIDVYLEIRAAGIHDNQQQTLRLVRDQLSGLDVKLEEARLALAQYRQTHQITSAERQENEVMARLDGLNESLNTAIEEEVRARAKLETLQAAIDKGKKVTPPNESEGVAAMEAELRKLKSRLGALTKTYTLEYVQIEPRYRDIPVRIAELEHDLNEIYAEGKVLQLAMAQQELEAAQQTVTDLQAQLDTQQQSAAQFTNIYATHQALVEDLTRLEELNRDAQARMVEVQVNPVEKYPQVSVIDRPGGQSQRLGPDYALWLGGTALAALVFGVLSVWLYGFLAPRRPEPAYVTLSGVHMYPGEGQEALTDLSPAQLAASGEKLLQQNTTGEGTRLPPKSDGVNKTP